MKNIYRSSAASNAICYLLIGYGKYLASQHDDGRAAVCLVVAVLLFGYSLYTYNRFHKGAAKRILLTTFESIALGMATLLGLALIIYFLITFQPTANYLNGHKVVASLVALSAIIIPTFMMARFIYRRAGRPPAA